MSENKWTMFDPTGYSVTFYDKEDSRFCTLKNAGDSPERSVTYKDLQSLRAMFQNSPFSDFDALEIGELMLALDYASKEGKTLVAKMELRNKIIKSLEEAGTTSFTENEVQRAVLSLFQLSQVVKPEILDEAMSFAAKAIASMPASDSQPEEYQDDAG